VAGDGWAREAGDFGVGNLGLGGQVGKGVLKATAEDNGKSRYPG
jgi:hypothetical protein